MLCFLSSFLSLSSGHTHTKTHMHTHAKTALLGQPKQDSCCGNRPQGTFSPERLLHYWKTSSFMSTGTSCLPEQAIHSRTCTPAHLVTWECPVNRSCHVRCTGRTDLGVHRLRNPLGPDTDGTDNGVFEMFFSSALISDQEANKGGFSSWVFSGALWIDGWWFTTQWAKLWGMDYMLSAKDNDQSNPVLNPDPLEPVRHTLTKNLFISCTALNQNFKSFKQIYSTDAEVLAGWANCGLSRSWITIKNLFIRSSLFGTQCANLHVQAFVNTDVLYSLNRQTLYSN